MSEKLEKNKISEIDPSELVDICSVTIDPARSREERIRQFLEQIKNPYLFRYGDLVIQSVFADTETSLEDCLEQYRKSFCE